MCNVAGMTHTDKPKENYYPIIIHSALWKFQSILTQCFGFLFYQITVSTDSCFQSSIASAQLWVGPGGLFVYYVMMIGQ